MTDEHMGTCIYEKGRFELRETDNAIIDLRGDFPPIMIASNTVDDGSEPNCADTRSVFHLLNELADNNPNEERHWYLKKMLDKAWTQYHEQKDENEQLKQDRFICLDCKHSGYAEIGCLCEKKDHWTDYKSECEDYEELE